jgi:hypothetical protein
MPRKSSLRFSRKIDAEEKQGVQGQVLQDKASSQEEKIGFIARTIKADVIETVKELSLSTMFCHRLASIQTVQDSGALRDV